MKVALVYYPMLFQRKGGLQIQVLQTFNALKALEVDVTLFNYLENDLNAFDVIHVFSIANGNENIIRVAKELNKKVVLSPLARCNWTKNLGRIAKTCSSSVGKLTGYHVLTDYTACNEAYKSSDNIIFLGEQEKISAMSAFDVDEVKCNIVPNGINEDYFTAKQDLYKDKYKGVSTKPIVLVVATINRNKNQLALVQALKESECEVHLIGPCEPSEKLYLEEILKYKNTKYIGYLAHEDPLLASAYAAAKLFCLPSLSEVLPLTIFEALAAGTPVVATNNSAIEFLEAGMAYTEFDPKSVEQIKQAVELSLANGVSIEQCRNLVKGKSWQSVAQSLKLIYQTMV